METKIKMLLMELDFLASNMGDFTHYEYSKKLRNLVNKLDSETPYDVNVKIYAFCQMLQELHRFLY